LTRNTYNSRDYLDSSDKDYTGFSLMLDFIEESVVRKQIDQPIGLAPPVAAALHTPNTSQGWFYFPGVSTALTSDPNAYTYRNVIQTQLKTFYCPANRQEGQLNIVVPWVIFGFPSQYAPTAGCSDYAMCKGMNAFLDAAPFSNKASQDKDTGFTASSSAMKSAHGNAGIPLGARGIFDTNSNVRISDVTDGTSNTILLGEAVGGHNRYLCKLFPSDTTPAQDGGRPIPIDQAWGIPVNMNTDLTFGVSGSLPGRNAIFGSYYCVTSQCGGYNQPGDAWYDATGTIDLNEPMNPQNGLCTPGIDFSINSSIGAPTNPVDSYNAPDLTYLAGKPPDTLPPFRSIHPGGCNFCYADGSVHYITDTVAMQTLKALSTYQGGEIVVQP
jgi:prepilin-type processing-associated H-X9-DG protein